MSLTPPSSASDPLLRRAGVFVFALTVVAFVYRIVGVSTLGLDHFDAGGYGMSARAVAEGMAPEALYPKQHYLSPPFLFGAGGFLMRLLGTKGDLILVLLSITLGTLTVPLVYALGRAWHGTIAGVASAALFAVFDVHAQFSRVALTDASFLFWFLLALWAFTLARERQSLRWTILAGIATGLAWNTKYHGWFAVVIAAAAEVPAILADRKSLRPYLVRMSVASLVAAGLYLPWFLYVRGLPGGYADLVREHSRFLDDWRHSLGHIRKHWESQWAFNGMGTRAALPLALMLAWSCARKSLHEARWELLFAAALLLWIPFGGGMPTLVLLGILGIGSFRRITTAGPAMHLAFFGLFSLTTPLYHPYARLLLPWLAALVLLVGSVVQALVLGSNSEGLRKPWRRWALASVFAITVATSLMMPRWPLLSPFQASDGFLQATSNLPAAIDPELPIFVIGEPAVVFYLRELGRRAAHVDQPEEALEVSKPGSRIAVIEGHYARLVGRFAAWRTTHPELFREGPEIAVPTLSLVRALDDHRASAAVDLAKKGNSKSYVLRVFEVTVPIR